MSTVAAVAFCTLLAALAVFQIALIAGAPLGAYAWGGQDRVLPAKKRVGSVTSIVLYGLFAAVALERVGLIDLLPPGPGVIVAMWVVFGYLVVGIALNALSRSRRERAVMTPLVVVLAVLALIVALA